MFLDSCIPLLTASPASPISDESQGASRSQQSNLWLDWQPGTKDTGLGLWLKFPKPFFESQQCESKKLHWNRRKLRGAFSVFRTTPNLWNSARSRLTMAKSWRTSKHFRLAVYFSSLFMCLLMVCILKVQGLHFCGSRSDHWEFARGHRKMHRLRVHA